MQNLNRVHRFERDGQIEVMMCGLTVVDAKTVQKNQGLLEAATAQSQVSLRSASTALFEKDRGVTAQWNERRRVRESVLAQWQHKHGAGRLGQRDGNWRAQNNHGFTGMRQNWTPNIEGLLCGSHICGGREE